MEGLAASDRLVHPALAARRCRPPKTATKAKLLWDREYLYFLAEMDDTDLYADVQEHDGMTWDNDVFELFFKPADDKPGYYEFQVNAAGTVIDMFLPRRSRRVSAFHWGRRFPHRGQGQAPRHAEQVERQGQRLDGRGPIPGAIPHTGGRPEVGESWKFALCRYDYSVDFEGPELSTCAPTESLDASRFSSLRETTRRCSSMAAPKAPARSPVGITSTRRPASPDLASLAPPIRRRLTDCERIFPN